MTPAIIQSTLRPFRCGRRLSQREDSLRLLTTAQRPNTEVILAGEFPRRSGRLVVRINCLRALDTETEPLCFPMLSDISKGFAIYLRIDGSTADR